MHWSKRDQIIFELLRVRERRERREREEKGVLLRAPKE